jgi:hypothetical protein
MGSRRNRQTRAQKLEFEGGGAWLGDNLSKLSRLAPAPVSAMPHDCACTHEECHFLHKSTKPPLPHALKGVSAPPFFQLSAS